MIGRAMVVCCLGDEWGGEGGEEMLFGKNVFSRVSFEIARV